MSTLKKRKQRTWSAFGEVRKLPSEYEIVTHETNWTLREGRKAALEQNPSSPANLWYLTYREGSPLQVPNWNAFRDPDQITYKHYVSIQGEQETRVAGLLDEFSDANNDATYNPEWRRFLGQVFNPTRYLAHGAQQIAAYYGHMAPSSYITNAATFAAGDLLRWVSLIAYRTKELQDAWPDEGFGVNDRGTWENDPAWQPARKAVEYALTSYDWGESFTAVNLVLLPTLSNVLLTQVRDAAHANGDELTWLLLGSLELDAQRRDRWSAELARFAISERAENAAALQKWIDRWAPRADAAAEAIGSFFAMLPAASTPAADVAQRARTAREKLLATTGLGEVPATTGS